MKFVYIIQSIVHPSQYYTGITNDIQRRLEDHNSGKSPHTNRYKPWKLISYTYFAEDDRAAKFEQYLKTGSGFAFSKRHFR
jgi:predicted GIY-YIG superfamily endonuclease